MSTKQAVTVTVRPGNP